MMEHIETIELGSSQASIEFTSIPQDYDDLVVYINARSDSTGPDASIQFNSDSGGNYSRVYMRGDNGNVNSFSFSGETNITMSGASQASSDTANTFSNVKIYISNYVSSSNKPVSAEIIRENNSASAYALTILAGLYSTSSAITSIEIDATSPNFVSGSTFSLYGVTAGGDGTVTTA